MSRWKCKHLGVTSLQLPTSFLDHASDARVTLACNAVYNARDFADMFHQSILGDNMYWELKEAWPRTYGADLSENHRQCSIFHQTSPKDAPLLLLLLMSCSPAASGILLQAFYLDFPTLSSTVILNVPDYPIPSSLVAFPCRIRPHLSTYTSPTLAQAIH